MNSMKPNETEPSFFTKIWRNRKKILSGLGNRIFKTRRIEKMAAARAAICNVCPDIDIDGSRCLVPLTQPCCGLCGCSLALLQRSPDSECEAGKWGKEK